ncbi:MAG: nucleoside-diphosphate sugar epimerase/dehydratase [Prevotella sp.]|nr:polysaccharide biosynthesis protein [Prevotella sp.]MCI6718237.1 polysaccharide biosynthesis protein [Prevotella sp.]MCI6898757.1 polysaccharide biosynthesis protein [Prevotella sp.]MDY5078667.1 nucleoside-diphosphate sugar epimerase/dehydratase [Prevotella sp.]MDY5308108.1 nucleoside-diphosphate sugar epimerase/dehydratase [Prevotella sp.]
MNFTNKLINWYFNKKSLPYWCVFLFDCAIVFFSFLLVYQQTYGGAKTLSVLWQLCSMCAIYAIFYAVGFKMFHTYDGILRYSSFVDLQRVGYASLVGCVLSYLGHFVMLQFNYFQNVYVGGREIALASLISVLLLWAVRVLVKTVYDVSIDTFNARPTVILGIDEGGIGLAKLVRNDKSLRMRLFGFVSDGNNVRHKVLMGLDVYQYSDVRRLVKQKHIECLLVSQGAIDEFRKDKALQDMLIAEGVHIYMPRANEEWNPAMPDATLKEVSIEDLLPRDEISIDLKSVADTLHGKCILVTGSAGSIGSEIVKQLCQFNPRELVLIDSAETPQHDIRLMMAKRYPHIKAETIVTSITGQLRMENIFRRFRPDYVFHAAAYKHVPMMENNPTESVENNIYGTKVLADMAVKYGVKKFVMISTDKAVNPTNVMGCSKRICEMYVQSLNNAVRSGKVEGCTQFVTTRFGNVLGSNGSVIPLFKQQIKAGGPVTVTDPNIIRYFMLIPEACELVLEAGVKGNGGEIFVFDMGNPVKIADLAQRMINLSGAKNVEIKYTGLRAGEKLYEEVLNDKESTKPSFHEKIRIANVREYDYSEVERDIEELIEVSKQYDDMLTVKKMKEIVPEFKSNNSVYEALDAAVGTAKA